MLVVSEASPDGVALVGDATEGVIDRQFVDHIGIVIVEPFLGFDVVRVVGVGDGVERLVEAGDAAAILGRGVALAGDVARVGEIGVAGADIGEREPVLPAIAEVVEIIDRGLARPQHVAQADLAGVGARFGSPVLVDRQAVSALGDGELPEVVVEPPHRDLDDVVQDLEGDRCRHLDLAPNHRVAVAQLDANAGDLVEAVERSAGSWPGSCRQFGRPVPPVPG